jgi:S1-C subfamily serine protease
MKLALASVSLVFLGPLSVKAMPPAPADSKVFVLEPFKVKGTAASNFAIDIRILVDAGTKKVFKMVVTRVAEDSDASDLGLQVGDEIVKIDGVPVEGMDSKVDRTSQIGRIFLNRHSGDSLKLEIITRRTQEIRLRAQAPKGVR